MHLRYQGGPYLLYLRGIIKFIDVVSNLLNHTDNRVNIHKEYPFQIRNLVLGILAVMVYYNKDKPILIRTINVCLMFLLSSR